MNTVDASIEICTKGGTEPEVHVVIEALVEVAITIEIPLKDLALSMLSPHLKVAWNANIVTLIGFFKMGRVFLETRVLCIGGKAVKDVITLTRRLKEDSESCMGSETGGLRAKGLSKKTIKKGDGLVACIRRKTVIP